jgi:L-histidine N-alpha-methyltransferase
LPEYYPTRTEAAIFTRHIDEIAAQLPSGLTLVDIGAGNCEKAARLLVPFKVRSYVAVDISVDFLGDSLARLQLQHPELPILGVGTDFSRRLLLPRRPATESVCCSIPVRVSAILRRRRRSISCASYTRRRRVAGC